MFLTIFTPTFNRAHTLKRLYDSLCIQDCIEDFEWLVVDDGSTDSTKTIIEEFKKEKKILIRYIYKENGGLYTGYNTAYANMSSELSMCMDSDDYFPSGAIYKIKETWKRCGNRNYVGMVGLAYNHDTDTPIGGFFPQDLRECFYTDLYNKKLHFGDTAPVFRTELMQRVAPQIGFEGEKNFNPVYMIMQVCDELPLLVINDNLMIKEYQQNDSMSKAIYRQYLNSPRSFAKMRILEMQLKHNTILNKIRCAVHYVSSCIIAKDAEWLQKSPLKLLTVAVAPIGFLWYCIILYKSKK